MKYFYILLFMLIFPVFANAKIFPETLYAITPTHISYETINEGNCITLFTLEGENSKQQTININHEDEIQVLIEKYINAKRGKRNGFFKVIYVNNDNQTMYGKMRVATKKDMKNIAQKASITIVGHILKIPGFSQAIALSKGIIKPNGNESRLKSASKNLYESTPFSYLQKGKEFNLEEDGIVVLKIK